MNDEIKEVRYYLLPSDWRMVYKVLAILVSWYFNKSLLWLVIHYLFGWIYLIYILLMGGFSNGGITDIINFYFN
jgi:hypothetical protein|tara:strand:+ start:224 stop:445 length:222 start_codon:yes stop_codon:yes gene_type:complete